jgi:undecaprenyl-diphosphatase
MFSILKNLNKLVGKFKQLDAVAIFCARFLPYLMSLFLVVFFVWKKEWLFFIIVLLSGIFARFIINETIYLFYKSKRPAQFEGVKALIPIPKYPSFPSGHASFFFGLSFALFFYNIIIAIIFVILSIIMGISRVFCGVHWFKDILAGMFVGLVSSLFISYLISII